MKWNYYKPTLTMLMFDSLTDRSLLFLLDTWPLILHLTDLGTTLLLLVCSMMTALDLMILKVLKMALFLLQLLLRLLQFLLMIPLAAPLEPLVLLTDCKYLSKRFLVKCSM
jgi:hypothetical protein